MDLLFVKKLFLEKKWKIKSSKVKFGIEVISNKIFYDRSARTICRVSQGSEKNEVIFRMNCYIELLRFSNIISNISLLGSENYIDDKYFEFNCDEDEKLLEKLDKVFSDIEHWIINYNFEERINTLKIERPDTPIISQYHHLSALAWYGDYGTLLEYEKTFERGFKLNFHPSITKEVIDRALSIAYDIAFNI